MIWELTQDTDDSGKKPSVSHWKGHTMIPMSRCLSLRIGGTFFLQALFIPAVQSAYCLWAAPSISRISPPQNPLPQYGCVGIPFTASGSPCFGNSPRRLLEVISLQSPTLFRLKGEGPCNQADKNTCTHSSPQVSHKPQIPPAPVPLCSSFLPGPRPSSSPRRSYRQPEARSHQHMVLRSMHIDIGRQDDFSS